ncbi:MAG: NAD(P)/FAD-dependent oxidoreductase [Pseudomonadota bacterium]
MTGLPARRPDPASSTAAADGPRRLVIVGGGIGGIALARKLANHPGFDVTLLDRQNHFVFQPLLYQVATSALGATDIAVPIRFLLRRAGNVRGLQAEVTGVDARARRVDTSVGAFGYDVLVVAAGVESSYFGHPEWEQTAPSLKTLADAARIRERVLGAFERAEALEDPVARARELTFVVVGAGPTGVELAGALAELAKDALRQDFRRIDPRDARVLLVEAGARALTMFEPSLGDSAIRFLRERGVDVRLNTRVTDITPDGVALGAERVRSANVIWAAGVHGSPVGAWLPAERDRAGRVLVNDDCSLPGHPEIFVIGDLAHYRPPNKSAELPAVGGVALQMGHHVARLLKGEPKGRPRKAFAYFDRGQMATIGRNHAIAEIRRLHFAGRLAWWMWLFIHLVFLAGFRNRLAVLLHWGWSYVTLERGARLIVQPPRTEKRVALRAPPAPSPTVATPEPPRVPTERAVKSEPCVEPR